MTPILQIEGIGKFHPDGQHSVLFTEVSAVIAEPEIIAVLGASGQGKSMLLRILGRLERHDNGSISLMGKAMDRWNPREWRMKATYVAQQSILYPGSIEDNLRLVSRIHGKPFERDLARKLMAEAGLDRLDWSKPVQDLSGGEKQRVALVRSLLLHPAILLLDEVTASLDLHSRHAMESILVDWHGKEGTTLIWVTHNLDQAKHCSRRVWFLAERTLLDDTDTNGFFRGNASAAAKRFLQLHAGGES